MKVKAEHEAVTALNNYEPFARNSQKRIQNQFPMNFEGLERD